MQYGPEIWIGDTPEEVAQEALRRLHLCAQHAIEDHSCFRVVLAGGQTPKLLYQTWAQDVSSHPLAAKTEFWFGDERYVSHQHPDSNFRLAQETLLAPMHVFSQHVVAVETQLPLQEASQQYQNKVEDLFAQHPAGFDLVLLGLGPDGHTASLFPLQEWVQAPSQTKCIAVPNAPKAPRERLSLTPPALNRTQNAFVLVTGADKAAAVCAALESDASAAEMPIRAIAPVSGNLVWLIDQAAAAGLTHTL